MEEKELQLEEMKSRIRGNNAFAAAEEKRLSIQEKQLVLQDVQIAAFTEFHKCCQKINSQGRYFSNLN